MRAFSNCLPELTRHLYYFEVSTHCASFEHCSLPWYTHVPLSHLLILIYPLSPSKELFCTTTPNNCNCNFILVCVGTRTHTYTHTTVSCKGSLRQRRRVCSCRARFRNGAVGVVSDAMDTHQGYSEGNNNKVGARPEQYTKNVEYRIVHGYTNAC